MKKALSLVITFCFCLGLIAVAGAGTSNKLTLKVGDEIYACACGDKCPCLMLSKNPGKCNCDKDMVKAKVVKVAKGTADLTATGWEKPRTFKTVGAYMCACGPDCKCDTIAQKAGKCTCGKDMKKAN